MTPPNAADLFACGNSKAGMQNANKERINENILRESKNSSYFEAAAEKDKAATTKINLLKTKLRLPDSPANIAALECPTQLKIDKMISLRRTNSYHVVVDFDAFYINALLTQEKYTYCQDDPTRLLKDAPCCVGGKGRSVITTSNYVARQYGVRAAMGGWIGDKLVSELSNGTEHLYHLPHDFTLFKKISHDGRSLTSPHDPRARRLGER